LVILFAHKHGDNVKKNVMLACTLFYGFYAKVRCRLRHYTKAAVEGDQKQRHAGTKNGLQALIKAKQRKEASGKSASQIQASSDANTHNSKHKLRGGGGKNNPSKSKA